MTGEQLRDELARVAERAPTVDVPADLFDRGRRATLRQRALGTAVAVACLAAVAAVTVPLVRSDDAPTIDHDAPRGVPDQIFGPDLGERAFDLPLAQLDDVGPAAAAYQVGDIDDHVVLITDEGHYRAVLLPDRWDPGLDEVSPRLSPDGRQLAYASERDDVRGLSIVDLTSGVVRDVSLGGGPYGALVNTLQWSPDARWLVWSGQAIKAASGNASSYRGETIAGTIGPRATRSGALPDDRVRDAARPGICNDGFVLTHVTGAAWERLVGAHGACTPPESYFRHRGPQHYRLLGWLPGGSGQQGPVAVVQIEHERLVLAWPGGARERVGSIEAGWSGNLTVATGLMSADRPTVEAGPSPWDRPWLVEHWIEVVVLLVVCCLAALLAIRLPRAVRR